jgi:hypothetical protein
MGEWFLTSSAKTLVKVAAGKKLPPIQAASALRIWRLVAGSLFGIVDMRSALPKNQQNTSIGDYTPG